MNKYIQSHFYWKFTLKGEKAGCLALKKGSEKVLTINALTKTKLKR
jgi:hypothetical protein